MPDHYIYPINPKSGYWFESDDGEITETSMEELYSFILKESRDVHDDKWGLSKCFNLMQPGDYMWIYAAFPHSALVALTTITKITRERSKRENSKSEFDGHYVFFNWNLAATKILSIAPIPRVELGLGKTGPQGPQRASATAVSLLSEWIDSHGVVT